MQLNKKMVDKTSSGWFMLHSWCIFNHCFVYITLNILHTIACSPVARKLLAVKMYVSHEYVQMCVCVCVCHRLHAILTCIQDVSYHVHVTFWWPDFHVEQWRGRWWRSCPASESKSVNFVLLLSPWLLIKKHCLIALLKVHHDLTFSIK